jgi:hypothetical protein
VEDCIDDLNDFHFKKFKSNLPTFEKNYALHDDEEDDYFIVHTDWLIRKFDSYNKQKFEKNRDISENFCVNDQILIQGLIKHQHNHSVICDRIDVKGGNSFVSHRYNVDGETNINRLFHDMDNHRIISKDT